MLLDVHEHYHRPLAFGVPDPDSANPTPPASPAQEIAKSPTTCPKCGSTERTKGDACLPCTRWARWSASERDAYRTKLEALAVLVARPDLAVEIGRGRR